MSSQTGERVRPVPLWPGIGLAATEIRARIAANTANSNPACF
jgi:hypothetical protein